MPFRGMTACILGLLTTALAVAQVGQPCVTCPDQPPELLPLFIPPSTPTNPGQPPVPVGPVTEYDHNYLYLPDFVPPAVQEPCGPLGRWWVNPDGELAWIPTPAAPASIRLRVPTAEGSIPGPILPVGGLTPERFQGGFGLTAGAWLDSANTEGIEAGLFILGGSDRTFEGYAPGMLVLNPSGHDQYAPQVIVLSPGSTVVGVFPTTLSTWFMGADINYRHNVYCSPNLRLDALVGYRFAYLQDEVYLGNSEDGNGDDYRRNRLAVSNQFHGGQIGLAGEFRSNGWYIDGALKLALGAVLTNVSATGLFMGAEGEDPSGAYSRLAALADSQARFAVLPTLDMTVGKQIREHVRIYAGYSLQYLSRVVRMADVLDSSSGSTPTTTDFWVSSVKFGVEVRY
jgi:hypothetical protein